MKTKTFDSQLAWYVGQLEKFDPTFNAPMFSVSWGRDIDILPCTLSDELTSFIRDTIGGGGSQSATGKPWLDPNSTTLPGVSVNGTKVNTPFRLLGREVSIDKISMQKAADARTVRNPAQQQLDALNDIYQLDTDAMVYIGDTEVNAKGLVNADTLVGSKANVAGADADGRLWSGTGATKDADDIITDINEAFTAGWAATGYKQCPTDCLLPPDKFAYIAETKVSTAADKSVLTYIEENSIALRLNGKKPNIRPLKWLTAGQATSVNRMVVYTNDRRFVRFPMAALNRFETYTLGLKVNTPYAWGYGEVEFVYPETVVYRDGI